MINIPNLDPNFKPFIKEIEYFETTAKIDLTIALVRDNNQVNNFKTKIFDNIEKDLPYIERVVKFLLWSRGGYKVILNNKPLAEKLTLIYDTDRIFDKEFMQNIYEMPFEIVYQETPPTNKENATKIGGYTKGYRIGFDAGGSDRKVSAVVNGEAIFSEETVWFPKLNEDPEYHYEGIVSAFKSAAEKMPQVDSIGISSAGIYIDNKTRVASLFLKVPQEKYSKVTDIYIRAAKEIGDIPITVVNDGDVTALAGSLSLGSGKVLGIAMGTSEAAGYVDANGNITGWLNELAFAPVDLSKDAMIDEWSHDIGCGVKYFSQDGVIKLAEYAGIDLPSDLSLGEKLKFVQTLLNDNDNKAKEVFTNIGIYLGHTVALYNRFYDIEHILLLGRVMSGTGGELIIQNAKKVLSEEYPNININLTLPDEKFRRVGQSVVAASLPKT